MSEFCAKVDVGLHFHAVRHEFALLPVAAPNPCSTTGPTPPATILKCPRGRLERVHWRGVRLDQGLFQINSCAVILYRFGVDMCCAESSCLVPKIPYVGHMAFERNRSANVLGLPCIHRVHACEYVHTRDVVPFTKIGMVNEECMSSAPYGFLWSAQGFLPFDLVEALAGDFGGIVLFPSSFATDTYQRTASKARRTRENICM